MQSKVFPTLYRLSPCRAACILSRYSTPTPRTTPYMIPQDELILDGLAVVYTTYGKRNRASSGRQVRPSASVSQGMSDTLSGVFPKTSPRLPEAEHLVCKAAGECKLSPCPCTELSISWAGERNKAACATFVRVSSESHGLPTHVSASGISGEVQTCAVSGCGGFDMPSTPPPSPVI